MEYDVRNVLSNEKREDDSINTLADSFHFDLQLFGRHGHGGKGGSKGFFAALGFIAGFAIGGMGVLFGVAKYSLSAAIMGASLFAGIWSATHNHGPNNRDNGSLDVSRFDRMQETMSSDGQIPIVYGMRKISGNQTFHQTDADANKLHKHVVLCEGGIGGIVSVVANDFVLPTGTQTSNTVFTLTNVKYNDAYCSKRDKTFQLSAGGKVHNITLMHKKEFENADTAKGSYWEYQLSVASLISYINQLYSEGWQAFPVASTTSYPADLHDISGSCYSKNRDIGSGNFLNFEADTVRGGSNYTFHDCEPPSNYQEVGGYPHMAWLDMNFVVSQELNGNPSVSCVVKGKKVVDTRTGKEVYTTNPAMCLRDFMLSSRYGLGRWIRPEDLDEDSFKEAADYCDQVIAFEDASGAEIREKRFELNMVIDQKQSATAWLQEILANFQAYLTISYGKFKLNIEKQTPVSYEFNDDNAFDLSIAPLSLTETPNKYVVRINDPLNNWSTISCMVEDYADQKERQKIITKEVNLNGTTTQYQALRLARYYRDQNLVCPLNVSWKTGVEAMHLECGDVVTLSYHDVFDGLPVRIMEIKQAEEGGQYEITGRQYNDTIYYDGVGGGVHWYNYTIAEDIGQHDNSGDDDTKATIPPAQPSALKAWSEFRRYEDGKTGYDVHLTYQLPTNKYVETGVVYYKVNTASGESIGVFPEGKAADEVGFTKDWVYAGDGPAGIVIRGAKLGDIYLFRVQTRNIKGLVSNATYAPTIYCRVIAKELVPSQPYGLRYDFADSFLFMWNDVPDSDVLFYELRLNEYKGSTVGLLGRTQGTSLVAPITERVGDVYVYAVNSNKKYSYPAKCHYEYPKPQPPQQITFSDAPRGARVYVTPFPAGVRKVAVYFSGTKSSERVVSENDVFIYTGQPDIYDVQAAYIDLLGEGYKSADFELVVNPTFNPEWIKDASISVKKFDQSVHDNLNNTVNAAKELLQRNIDDNVTALKTADELLKRTIDSDVTELKAADGEIRSTVANKEKQIYSEMRQTASEIKADVVDKNNKMVSEMRQTASEIRNTVADVNNRLGSEINQTASRIQSNVDNLANQTHSQIQQLSDQVNVTIASAQQQMAARIQVNADQISHIVTNLNRPADQTGYSALTQMVDGINMRVVKGDVINQINMTPRGTYIKGEYLHVTGTTLFDDDVITNGMIRAGAVSADKIHTDKLSAICATIGHIRTKSWGARVEITDDLITVYDENNRLRVKLGVW